MQNKVKALLYCFLMTVIFSGHYLVAKRLLREVNPFALSSVRGLAGGFLILLIYSRRVREHLNSSTIWKMSSIAFFGFFINQILFMNGLKMTTPVNAAIICNGIPVVSTGLAILLSLERFGLQKFAGLFMGLTGLSGYFLYQYSFNFIDHLIGNVLIFGNVVALSLSMVLCKKAVKDIPPPLVSGFTLFLGGMMLFSMSAWHYPHLFRVALMSLDRAAMLVFEVIMSTALVYWLNFNALKMLHVSTVTVFGYMQPLMTAILSFFIFHEIPNRAMFPLFLLIIGAGYLVVRSDKSSAPA